MVDYRPVACVNCKNAHVACDRGRPCSRCLRLNKVETCVDAERKKRGRPQSKTVNAVATTTAAGHGLTSTALESFSHSRTQPETTPQSGRLSSLPTPAPSASSLSNTLLPAGAYMSDHTTSKPPQVACVNCKHAHVACDRERPCRRCTRLHIAENCIDPPESAHPPHSQQTFTGRRRTRTGQRTPDLEMDELELSLLDPPVEEVSPEVKEKIRQHLEARANAQYQQFRQASEQGTLFNFGTTPGTLNNTSILPSSAPSIFGLSPYSDTVYGTGGDYLPEAMLQLSGNAIQSLASFATLPADKTTDLCHKSPSSPVTTKLSALSDADLAMDADDAFNSTSEATRFDTSAALLPPLDVESSQNAFLSTQSLPYGVSATTFKKQSQQPTRPRHHSLGHMQFTRPTLEQLQSMNAPTFEGRASKHLLNSDSSRGAESLPFDRVSNSSSSTGLSTSVPSSLSLSGGSSNDAFYSSVDVPTSMLGLYDSPTTENPYMYSGSLAATPSTPSRANAYPGNSSCYFHHDRSGKQVPQRRMTLDSTASRAFMNSRLQQQQQLQRQGQFSALTNTMLPPGMDDRIDSSSSIPTGADPFSFATFNAFQDPTSGLATPSTNDMKLDPALYAQPSRFEVSAESYPAQY